MTMPPPLPPIPRGADGKVTAGQVLLGVTQLYEVAGDIRLQLIGLIEAEKARHAADKAD
ncbi:MAG: hypothetical protein U5M50_03880 [Sphingobium sp.]|nr:hypothetical protein [Sphingobium sp.]